MPDGTPSSIFPRRCISSTTDTLFGQERERENSKKQEQQRNFRPECENLPACVCVLNERCFLLGQRRVFSSKYLSTGADGTSVYLCIQIFSCWLSHHGWLMSTKKTHFEIFPTRITHMLFERGNAWFTVDTLRLAYLSSKGMDIV